VPSIATTAVLRRAFVDVCRGYSIGQTGGRTFYVRHLGHAEHVDFELTQARFEEEAVAAGAQTEAARLAYLCAKGEWSAVKEKEIETQRGYIVSLEAGRATIAVPSVLRAHEEQTAQERKKLMEMRLTRTRALGMTVELYAQRRVEDYYIVHNLFADSELHEPFVSMDAFEDLEDEPVDILHHAYQAAMEPCSDANLRRLAVQDFFVSYYSLCGDNVQAFYGRPVCALTYHQVKLANMARYMKGVLDNTDSSKVAPDKRADPDALEQAFIMQKNLSAAQAEGRAPVGMTSADLRETGMKRQFSTVPPEGLSGVELAKWLVRNHRPG
jgi:hypothetical protein